MIYAIKITDGHVQGVGWFSLQEYVPNGWTQISSEEAPNISIKQTVTVSDGVFVFGSVDESFEFPPEPPVEEDESEVDSVPEDAPAPEVVADA